MIVFFGFDCAKLTTTAHWMFLAVLPAASNGSLTGLNWFNPEIILEKGEGILFFISVS